MCAVGLQFIKGDFSYSRIDFIILSCHGKLLIIFYNFASNFEGKHSGTSLNHNNHILRSQLSNPKITTIIS